MSSSSLPSSSHTRPARSLIPPERRVLSRDAALTLGRRLLAGNDQLFHVTIEHIAHSVTKVANGAALATEDGDVVKIGFPSIFGNGLEVMVNTNQLDDAMLQKVIAETLAKIPKPQAPSSQEASEPADVDGARYSVFSARPLPPVSLYHDASVQAMDSARGVVIPEMVGQLCASNYAGAATVRLMSRATLNLWRPGLTSYSEETDCEVTVTARTEDGKASGWHGQAHRDWAKIQPPAIVTRAIEMADRSRNPVALEPGRRVAILGPAAVAQLVYNMAQHFDFEIAGSGPFGYPNLNHKGRHTKVGQRVFDSRIVMVSDPADPDGGYPPFFDNYGKDLIGFPTPAVTYVNHGILERLALKINLAALRGLTPSENPYSMRLTTVPGTKTATLDEMIANCREGVYVNRFTDVREIDGRTGMMTGVTRDGCFLVKDGKITKALTNFRFTESPHFAFNQIEMIGAPERVAFGNSYPWASTMLRNGLPRLPVIVPPMMIKDFNFSALANAV